MTDLDVLQQIAWMFFVISGWMTVVAFVTWIVLTMISR